MSKRTYTKSETKVVDIISENLREYDYISIQPLTQLDMSKGYTLKYNIKIPIANVDIIRYVELLTADTCVIWDGSTHTIIKTITFKSMNTIPNEIPKFIPYKILNSSLFMAHCVLGAKSTTDLQRDILQKVSYRFKVPLSEMDIEKTYFSINTLDDTAKLTHIVQIMGKGIKRFVMTIAIDELL